MGEHSGFFLFVFVFFTGGAGKLCMVFPLWRSVGLFNKTYLYVYLNIGSVMAEGALYCMRVMGTQISLCHSTDCLESSLFTFVWFACVQPVGTPSRPYGRSGSPVVVHFIRHPLPWSGIWWTHTVIFLCIV